MRNLLQTFLLILCTGSLLLCQSQQKIKVLILTGENNHDWRATTPVLREILEHTGRFEVRVNEELRGCGPETFAPYDVLLLNYNSGKNQALGWDSRARQTLLDFVRNGKGLVSFHASNNSFEGWTEYDKLIGGTWRETAGHAPSHTFTVQMVDRDHPITRGLPISFSQTDELYHGLTLQPSIHILGTAFDDPKNCARPQHACGTGRDEPLIWTSKFGAGRVFQTALGHDVKAMGSAGFVTTLQRGTEWAATGDVTLTVPPATE
jgi:type 1 glutamine amidotransferase